MTPSVPTKCKAKVSGKEYIEPFPLHSRYRRMAGEGMVRFLLESKENVRRYLYDDCELCFKPTTDAKGRVTRIDIYAK